MMIRETDQDRDCIEDELLARETLAARSPMKAPKGMVAIIPARSPFQEKDLILFFNDVQGNGDGKYYRCSEHGSDN